MIHPIQSVAIKIIALATIALVALVTVTPVLSQSPTDANGPDSGGERELTKQVEPQQTEESYVRKSDQELRKTLTKIQYDVTQNESTERAFHNPYWNNNKDGVYKCVVCARELFRSDTKFKSGTGWPSFYAPVDKANVGLRSDFRLFYQRVEVHCSRCDAHLGHVFDDGPQPTGKRYCMNSASLKFIEEK